jgi:hypothetical protein
MSAQHNRVVQVASVIDAALIEHTVGGQCGLPMGAHVITSRRRYLHHGIYVGGGNVVHYSGWARGWHRGPVEEISLDQFRCGGTVWVKCRRPYRFDPGEVIRRARSRVGEDHYRIFSNNCEHFCEWCLHGEPRSYQVEALLSLPARVLEAARQLIARLVSLPIRMKLSLSLTGTPRSFNEAMVTRARERRELLRGGVFMVEGDKLC